MATKKKSSTRRWWCFSQPRKIRDVESGTVYRSDRGNGTCVYGNRATGERVRSLHKIDGKVGPLTPHAKPKKRYWVSPRDSKRRKR